MADSVVTVGIDVGKSQVEVALQGAGTSGQRFANDVEGHTALAANLKPLRVALVVLEATGGYEAELACTLQAAGLPVAVINPKQGRDFAKSLGRLAKTDRIDARTLAEFAGVLAVRPDLHQWVRPLPEVEQREMAALVTRRRQLMTMLLSEQQRLQLAPGLVRPSLEAMIRAIRAQLDEIEAHMRRHLRTHFSLRRNERVITLSERCGSDPVRHSDWWHAGARSAELNRPGFRGGYWV